MNDYIDYYSILGVVPPIDTKSLDAAYRDKVKTYHPDVYSGDKQFAEEEIKKINQAYAGLKDPLKREKHDQIWSERQNRILDIAKNDQQAIEKAQLLLKRKRQLDNQIMMWCILAIIVIFGMTWKFK